MESMQRLLEHLGTLFELCGIEPEAVEIRQGPALVRLAGRLVKDTSVSDYLDALDRQAAQAAGALSARLQEAETARQENRELCKRVEEQKAALKAGQKSRPAEKNAAPAPEAPAKGAADADRDTMEWIRNMIVMRDNLLMRRDWILDNSPQDKNAYKIVEGQLKETARILNKSGVEILEDTGAFDSSRHTVTGTRPASDDSQADQIAQVFRPGYAYRGEMLRGQEVILYTKEQE